MLNYSPRVSESIAGFLGRPLGSIECRQSPRDFTSAGRVSRIRVRTVNCVYVGDFLIPPMRNRVSDAINEEQRLFISLTDVVVNDKDRSDFVAVNKNLIESIAQI